MENETRKCAICKSYIYIEKDINGFIIENNKYIHINCYIQNKSNLKRNAWTIEQCQNKINELKEKTQKEISNRTIRKKVTDWIFKTYEISFLPTYFYTKLDSVYNGTYKGLSKPVPPEDLLDMWQRKINYLNNVAINNKTNGKGMDNSGRVNYDLAIILNKYDSYLEWKKEQEIIKNDILKRANEEKNAVNYNNIISSSKEYINKEKNKDNNESININDIINDI